MNRTMIRLGGATAMLGGIYLLVMAGFQASVDVDADIEDYPLIFQTITFMPLFLLLGAAGLLALANGRRGVQIGASIIGLGAILMTIGFALMTWLDNENGWTPMFFGMIAMPVGLLIFGAMNWQAGILSRWNKAPLIFGAVATALILLGILSPFTQRQSDYLFGLFLLVLAGGWLGIGAAMLFAEGATAVVTVTVVPLIVLLPWLIIAGRSAGTPPPDPLPTVSPQQQIIFHSGTIVTMDAENPQAEAIAITGQMITAVGTTEEVLALQTTATRMIDLNGLTLMPGFVDAHSHLFNDAEQYFAMTLPEVQQIALENGITTLGNMYVTDDFLAEMRRFEGDGQLRMRTSLYLVATDNCGKPLGNWWQQHPPSRKPGEMLRIGGVKLFTDGGTCGAPALSYELSAGEGLGDLFFTQAELNELVTAVHNQGHQAAIHAIGDRAIEQAQNAIATALAGEPNRLRHRIEHNSVIRPDLLPRYGELGIIPVLFGPYPLCEPFGPPPPAEYQLWEWPYRALFDANPGLPIAWHGDDPFFGRVRPLDDLYSLITRNEIGRDGQLCPGQAWQAQHLLTPMEALQMMTVNAAYALARDEEVGTLAPGKYADLIILSDNPLLVDPERIPQMDVWLTMVGGRVEFCHASQPELCP